MQPWTPPTREELAASMQRVAQAPRFLEQFEKPPETLKATTPCDAWRQIPLPGTLRPIGVERPQSIEGPPCRRQAHPCIPAKVWLTSQMDRKLEATAQAAARQPVVDEGRRRRLQPLSEKTLKVYRTLRNITAKHGAAFPSNETLAHRTRSSERTVRYALRALERAGLIITHERSERVMIRGRIWYKQVTSWYEITDPTSALNPTVP